MRLKPTLIVCLMAVIQSNCCAQDWPSLWKSYIAGFMDDQARVIDHDAGDRTTSEGQAYGMFFALVANDRSHFDALLHWTEQNLAAGDLGAHLPSWLWGHGKNNEWGVLDSNSAADADLWMAYTLLEAGKNWKEPRYTRMGMAMERRIAAEEVIEVPGLGTILAPGPTGFRHDDSYRLNASYIPLQLIVRLSHLIPDGPWAKVAAATPTLIADSAPHGFVSDWTDFKTNGGIQASPDAGSYDAIRVYLWAGMMDKATPHRDDTLKAIAGMAGYLRSNAIPAAKVRPDGTIDDPKGPVGFSAALLPYASALHEDQILNQQMSRVQSQFNAQTGLLGNPAKYYDQNLALFGLGFIQQQFSFSSEGVLELKWKPSHESKTLSREFVGGGGGSQASAKR